MKVAQHFLNQGKKKVSYKDYAGAITYFDKGIEIKGLDAARSVKDVMVFHAGTKKGRRAVDTDKTYITFGGRVLNVTALGSDMPRAIDKCDKAAGVIKFDKMQYRKDIGARALKRALRVVCGEIT